MNRQPKGIPVGGQFAEGRKPDGGDLSGDVGNTSSLICLECGQAMDVDGGGISHHLTEEGDIDYDADAEHVAFTVEDAQFEESAHQTDELIRVDDYCDYCEVEGHTFRSCPRRDDSIDGYYPDDSVPPGYNTNQINPGAYFESDQMTIRDGDMKVIEIARGLGFSSVASGGSVLDTYDDEAVGGISERALAWLNEWRLREGYYWGFENGTFGLWETEEECDDDAPDDDLSDDFPMSLEYDTSYEDSEYQ